LFALAVPAQEQGEKQVIRPAGFEPKFPYSPGFIAGDLVFVSGQGSRDPRTGKHPETWEGQVKQAVENVRVVLRAANMDMANVVSCHCYLDNLDLWSRMNPVYREAFGQDPPVRTSVGMAALPDESHYEITCIAARNTADIKAYYRGGKRPEKPVMFPPAIQVKDWVFTSGMTGREGDFEAQVKGNLENLGSALQEAKLGFKDVVWANIYVNDPNSLLIVEKVWATYFTGNPKPARAVEVVSLLPNVNVEIDLVAAASSLKAKATQGNGVLAGRTLFLSAQSAPGATIEEQVEGTFKKIIAGLRSAGMDLSDVANSHVYLKDIADFPRLNAVYRKQFTGDPPARTTLQVKQPGSSPQTLVEIAVVAYK
jgi:2-iminobutanoate/2-iminopropanoate deaminase